MAIATVVAVAFLPSAGAASASPSAGSWTPATLPPAPFPQYPVYIESSSCSSASFCVLVGYELNTGANSPLAYTYANGTWTSEILPLPGNGGYPTSNGALSSVSCPAEGVCAAIGTYTSLQGHQDGMLLTLSDGQWASAEAQLPEGPESGLVNLYSVSCSSPIVCHAVGDVFNSDQTQIGVDYAWRSGSWQMQRLPMPSDFGTRATISGVACPDDQDCIAVGSYSDSAWAIHGLLLTLQNSAWSAESAPLPANAATSPQGGRGAPFEPLNSVDCPQVGWCVAGGSFSDSAFNEEPLLLQLSDGIWAAQPAPVPADSQAATLARINSVDCPSAGYCIAAGTYFTDYVAGDQSGLIVTDNEGALTASTAPLPGGTSAALTPNARRSGRPRASTTTSSTGDTSLSGASCGTDAFCVVGGDDNTSPLAETNSVADLPSISEVSPDSGPIDGGTSVTITGTSFTPDSVAYFANTAAKTTYVSSTELKATAPAVGGGTVNVTVQGDGLGSRFGPRATFSYPCSNSAGRVLPNAVGIAAARIAGCPGYWVADSAGHVSASGSGVGHGDLTGVHLAAPIVGIKATPDGGGYWLVAADGGVFNFGDAHFYGSTGKAKLREPVVGMATAPGGKGYWLVAADGGVFNFGDAHFYGSTGNTKLNQPVIGIAPAPGGNGYWLAASDGGVFSFTSEGFYGSLGNVKLSKPIVGIASTPSGWGYTLVGADGGVFTFGQASFFGSLGNRPPGSPIVNLSPAPANDGYYLVSHLGIVYNFGLGTTHFSNAS